MKKKSVFSRVLEALTTLSPLLLSLAVIIFAFSQDFGIGLVILLGLVAIQLIIALKAEKLDLAWDGYNQFGFRSLWWAGQRSKRLNIVFNFTRVITIISVLIFSPQSGLGTNPLGGLVVTISMVLAFVCFVYFAISYANLLDYELIRGFAAIIILISLASCSYFYFGTLLIWLPALLSLVFCYSKGCIELDDCKEDGNFSYYYALLLSVSAISTIIQFWLEISNCFGKCFEGIMGFLTIKIFYVPIWVYLSVLILWLIYRWIVNVRADVLAERVRNAKLKEELARQDRDRYNHAQSLKSTGANNKNDILFLQWCYERKEYFSKLEIAKALVSADLFDSFVTVSEIKKKIVFEPKIKDILNMYNYLFLKISDDKVLKAMTDNIKYLSSRLSDDFAYFDKTGDRILYKGVETLISVIDGNCADMLKIK